MAGERVVAADIDLRQIAAWDSIAGTVCCEDAAFTDLLAWCTEPSLTGGAVDTVLIEVASPHGYSAKGVVFKKRQSWVIFNSMVASILAWRLNLHTRVLVSPSSTWTKGLPETVRHRLAGVIEPKFPRAKGRHDLKECQAMIWTYRQEPELWQPLETYLESL